MNKSSDGKEETNNAHDIVPWICIQREEIGGYGLPHVAPWVERHQRHAYINDVQPEAEAFTRLVMLHYQTRDNGDQHLRENPELPHGAIVKFEAQEVQADVETYDLNADDFKHLAPRRARLEVDVFLIGASPLQTENLHTHPDGLADGK